VIGKFVARELHHLRPAVVVEVEIRLDVGDFAGLGLGVAVFERGDVGVHRRVEKLIKVGTAVLTVWLLGLVEEDTGVEVDQFVVDVAADDRCGQCLPRCPVADVLTDFHLILSKGNKTLESSGTEPQRSREQRGAVYSYPVALAGQIAIHIRHGI